MRTRPVKNIPASECSAAQSNFRAQSVSIPAPVVRHFASDPVGPMYTLKKEAASPNSPVYSEIHEILSSIDATAIADTLRDPTFQHLYPPTIDRDQAARVWIAWKTLDRAIGAYRLDALCRDSRSGRPRLYSHPALKDLTPDDEHLLPLRHFAFDGSRLLRHGHAFMMLSTTGAPNSTHWLTHVCHVNDVRNQVRVRLDPLLHGPADEFHPPHERMRVWGQPLDWYRIERLPRIEHGRWMPDRQDGQTHSTEFFWNPHGSEVTFVCEEVPTLSAAPYRPGRYFHSIYLPTEATISHLDAAVRIYTDSEVSERHIHHVRNAGKIGLRVKVFRIDAPLSRTVLSSLCQAFFVWNRDVSDYFKEGCK